MADSNYKKDVAEYLRTQYTLPVEASDDDVIAYARSEAPDELSAIEKAAYTGTADVEPVKPRSLAGMAIESLDKTGDEINEQTQEWANQPLSNAQGPVEAAGIVANKGLAKGTEVSRDIGEYIEKASGSVNKGLDSLPMGVKQLAQLATYKERAVMDLVAAQFPRTPMQSVFAAVTTSAKDLMRAGKGLTGFLKTMSGKESTVAAKSVEGAIRSPSARFPESKLAASLENLLEGTQGKDDFNLLNKSKVNEHTRKVKINELGAEQLELGTKEEGFINQRRDYDLENTIRETNESIAGVKKGVADAKEGIAKTIAEKQAESLALQGRQLDLQEAGKRAVLIKQTQEAAIRADLAVDKALGMVTESGMFNTNKGGMVTGKMLAAENKNAHDAISNVYTNVNKLGEATNVSLESLDAKLKPQLKDLNSKLALINPAEKKGLKLLEVISEGIEETESVAKGTPEQLALRKKAISEFLEGSGKELKKLAEHRGEVRTANLQDLFAMYKDAGALYKSKGDRVFLEVKNAIAATIDEIEAGTGVLSGADAKKTIEQWKAANQARRALSVAFENETIKAILKESDSGHPEKIFEMLSGKNNQMALIRFMEVAPERAKQIVKRESLGRGLTAVSNAKGGKSVAALESWIESVGRGNYEALHAGKDAEALMAVARSNDSVSAVSKHYPAVGKQVVETRSAILELMHKYSKIGLDAEQDASKIKGAMWDKTDKIWDRSRKDVLARRAETVKRISDGIDAIEKAYEVAAKTGERGADAGKVILTGDRKGDFAGGVALGAGVSTIAGSYALEQAAGISVPKYVYGTAALGIAFGMYKKTPKWASNIYYSDKGRAVMEQIASAPNSKEAAEALLELVKLAGPSGARLGIMHNLDKNQKQPDKTPRPSLGKLSGLQKQAASGDGLGRILGDVDPEPTEEDYFEAQ